ncbi:MAG: RNA polymerase sigma factor, partial [Clostridiales Family XIII bacterium]|nr:RNA polymerase sigma factor [Clostridiales Family XIII bacterium]
MGQGVNQALELIRKASEGDVRAFDELYRSKLRTILYHVSRMIKNPVDVEDVAQEIGIQMYRGISALRDPEAFNGWMQRIITNECYRFLKKNVRKTDHVNIDDYVNTIEEENKEFLPKECLESEDTKRIIMQAIDKLPPKRKRAIIMYYYDDMSTKEIAYALGISLATVSTNIMRGKTMIKGELEKKMGAERNSGTVGTKTVVGQILAGNAALLYPDSSIDIIAQTFGQTIGDASFALTQVKAAAIGAKATIGAKTGAAVTAKTLAVITGSMVALGGIGYGLFFVDGVPLNDNPGILSAGQTQSSFIAEGADIASMKIVFSDGDCECGH